jgi:hypothetical protein
MAVGVLILAACGTGGEVEPGPITSLEDIAGTTYEFQGAGGPFFVYFFEDGTVHGSSNRDLVVDKPTTIHENRFEGTTVFLHQTKGSCDDNPDATYEIHLLENGNLQWVEIEDPCPVRSSSLNNAEAAPVP